jgi:microcystin degradation protein MlrC
MKIVLGSIQQESNTLTSRMSTIGDFTVFRGMESLPHLSVPDYFSSLGIEVVPTIYAHAVPGGMLAERDFLALADELLSMIPEGGMDGIWLYLHGAMEVEKIGSGELALLRKIRRKVGFGVPIALALDFHANNSFELMQLVNIVAGYRTAPHRDMQETELRAARLLVRCIEGNLLPKPRMARVNVVVPGDCVLTNEHPLRDIMAEALDLEKEPGMLICNVFNGQPWVDAPNMGPSMVCVHESDEGAAEAAARKLAQRFFDSRHEFKFSIEACEPAAALERISTGNDLRPAFVTDSGDNTTAGSAGDNAFMLKLMQEKGIEGALLGGLTDEPAVAQCYAKNVGDLLELDVGGTIEPASTRTHLRGRLLFKGDIQGWYDENAGPCAVLRCDGIDVVLTARRCALTKPGIFRGIGLELAEYRFVVVKLGYLYPELAKVARRTILAFTTGGSTERLQDMGMEHIRRPMFPLDDGFRPTFA